MDVGEEQPRAVLREFREEAVTDLDITRRLFSSIDLSSVKSVEIDNDLKDLLRMSPAQTTKNIERVERSLADLHGLLRSDTVQQQPLLPLCFVPIFLSRLRKQMTDGEYIAEFSKLNPPFVGRKRASIIRKRNIENASNALYQLSFKHDLFGGDFVPETDLDAVSYNPGSLSNPFSIERILARDSFYTSGDSVLLVGVQKKFRSSRTKRRDSKQIFDAKLYEANMATLVEGSQVALVDRRRGRRSLAIVSKVLGNSQFELDGTRTVDAMGMTEFLFTMGSDEQINCSLVLFNPDASIETKLSLAKNLSPTPSEIISKMRKSAVVEYDKSFLLFDPAVRSRDLRRFTNLVMEGSLAAVESGGRRARRAWKDFSLAEPDLSHLHTARRSTTEWDLAYEHMYSRKPYEPSFYDILVGTVDEKTAYEIGLVNGGRLAFDRNMRLLPGRSRIPGAEAGSICTFEALRNGERQCALEEGGVFFVVDFPDVHKIVVVREEPSSECVHLRRVEAIGAVQVDRSPVAPVESKKLPAVARMVGSKKAVDLPPPPIAVDRRILVEDGYWSLIDMSETNPDEAVIVDSVLAYRKVDLSKADVFGVWIDAMKTAADEADRSRAALILRFIVTMGGDNLSRESVDLVLNTMTRMRAADDRSQEMETALHDALQKNLRSAVKRFIQDKGEHRFPHEFGRDAREAVANIEGMILDIPSYSEPLKRQNERAHAAFERAVATGELERFCAIYACVAQSKLPASVFLEPRPCIVRRGRFPFSPTGFPLAEREEEVEGLVPWLVCSASAMLGLGEGESEKLFQGVIGAIQDILVEQPLVALSLEQARKRMEHIDRLRKGADRKSGAKWHAFRPTSTHRADLQLFRWPAAIQDEHVYEGTSGAAVQHSNVASFDALVGPGLKVARASHKYAKEVRRTQNVAMVEAEILTSKSLIDHLVQIDGLDAELLSNMNRLSTHVYDQISVRKIDPVALELLESDAGSATLARQLTEFVRKDLCGVVASLAFPPFEAFALKKHSATLSIKELTGAPHGFPEFDKLYVKPETRAAMVRLLMEILEPIVVGIFGRYDMGSLEEVGQDSCYEINLALLYIMFFVMDRIEGRDLLAARISDFFVRAKSSPAIDQIEATRRIYETQRERAKTRMMNMDDLDSKTREIIRDYKKYGSDWQQFFDSDGTAAETLNDETDEALPTQNRNDDNEMKQQGDQDDVSNYQLPDYDYEQDEIDEDMF